MKPGELRVRATSGRDSYSIEAAFRPPSLQAAQRRLRCGLDAAQMRSKEEVGLASAGYYRKVRELSLKLKPGMDKP